MSGPHPLTVAQVQALATPSNWRLGRQIVGEGGVRALSVSGETVVAKVGGVPAAEQTRAVSLLVSQEGVRWSCACTRRPGLFCKHCVAVAVAAFDLDKG